MYLLYTQTRGCSRSSQSSLCVFSFVFQNDNDNDLIDNDNAGQSPAAQAVVLTFSLTYYHLNTVFSFHFFFVQSHYVSPNTNYVSHTSPFTAKLAIQTSR